MKLRLQWKNSLLGRGMTVVLIIMAAMMILFARNYLAARAVNSIVTNEGIAVDMHSDMQSLIGWYLDYAFTKSADSQNQVNTLLEQVADNLSGLQSKWQNDAEIVPLISSAQSDLGALKTAGEALVASTASDNLANFHNAADKIESDAENVVTILDLRTQKTMTSSVRVSLIVGILVTIIITVSTVFFLLALIRSIQILVEFGNAMGEGDLTRTIHLKREDELGKLGKIFSAAVNRLNVTVTGLAEATALLGQSSQSMSASSVMIRDNAEKQSIQTSQVAKSLGVLNKTVAEMAQSSQKAADASHQAATEARSGGEVVNSTMKGMQRIAEAMRGSMQVVHSLGASSNQIGAIVKVIEDIADQTNLLALNAAIEAARAGEQGRGFAVVADEVRKLAERTTNATKEIGGMISKIQDGTRGVIESMEDGTKEVGQGVEMANKAGEVLRRIIGMVGQATDMISQIAAAAEEYSAMTEENSASVEVVANLSHTFSEDANKTYVASLELQKMSGQLSRLVQGFKLRKDEPPAPEALTRQPAALAA